MGNLEVAGEKDISLYGLSVQPTGFTRLFINGQEMRCTWQRDECVNDQGMLNATQVKAVFARLVRDAISVRGYERIVTDVKSQGPAVTLKIINSNGRKYSVDLTLAIIKDKTWPRVAEEWRTRRRNGWPNQSLVNKICQDGCHLVAKQPKGHDVPEHEKGCFWRFSFSAAEKNLFLHGGQGEASSCQKQVLRILKALRDELNLEPLKSYHLKTMLFYECEANPHPSQWLSTCLSDRFLGLLRRLENCLLQLNCPHYFIHNLNLFEMLNPKSALNWPCV
ncbi:hypothetical protein OS493_035134 [Desmophyllum pertusum]|uniref:Uncharacterized protein n=1 Tax=Desmophyllum pertusum TaxID=174260 RepID=A0A9W9YV31_9CNID|nr:hypothetical protein OS493_035134 [Desmophyllum pertusum]